MKKILSLILTACVASSFGCGKRETFQTPDGKMTVEQKGDVSKVEITTADGKTELHTVDEGIRFDVTLDGIKGVKLLREHFRIEPALVTGPATDNQVGVDIVEKRIGVKAINALGNSAALGDHLLEVISPFVAPRLLETPA